MYTGCGQRCTYSLNSAEGETLRSAPGVQEPFELPGVRYTLHSETKFAFA